jgi:hypothetical protein
MFFSKMFIKKNPKKEVRYKSFSKIFLLIQKKNVYPVHKSMLSIILYSTVVNFYLLVIFLWRAFIKESSHLCCKKKVGLESHKEINILV